MKIVVKDGKNWCPVPDAARYLKTTTPIIRRLMGSNQIAYTQIRKNGQIYVSVTDLVRVQTERLTAPKTSGRTIP